jgi:DNA-binding transcriptional regulator YhcF (GntR family)
METNTDLGFIKLWRNILDWEWYEHPDVSRVFFHLLLKSNYTIKKWQGITIDIGEFVTSTEKLCNALNLSKFKVKNALKKLEDSGYIKVETNNKFTKIKLLESDVYKKEPFKKQKQTEHQIENLTTNNPTSTQNQTETTNKEKKEEEIEKRKNIFKTEIFKFSNSFSQDHLESFFDYWCQENKQTGRLKFEDEQYWNLEFKLKNWVNFPKAVSKSGLTKKINKNRP